jgi:hypothetical protein
VMDHGKVVEMGDHKTLLAANGIYARLWAHQSGGFLGEEADEDEPTGRSDPAPRVGAAAAVKPPTAQLLGLSATDAND